MRISRLFKKEDHFEAPPPPSLPPPPPATNRIIEGTYNVTKFSGVFAIFWIIFTALSATQATGQFHIALTVELVWIGTGLIFGLFYGIVISHRQLKRLEENYVYSTFSKDLLIIAVPIVIFAFAGYVGSIIFLGFESSLLGSVSEGWLTSILAVGASASALRYLLFLAFERKKNVFIVQYWFGSESFTLSRASSGRTDSSSNNDSK
jgi:hypothetical protein